MIIIKKADFLSNYIFQQKIKAQKIGFVPTMGALHKGHMSLIKASKAENDLTVCSIFINPTQFNNAEDFKHYPVSIEQDIEQLVSAGCDILFLPSETEIYHDQYTKRHYDLGAIENILEGSYRPGHFQGVCQVVDRLLEIVQPHILYLGQKDFQQCMVIRKLLQLTGNDSKIQPRIAETIREEDGLAMSSRNLRLSARERKLAPAIYRTLCFIKENLHQQPIDDLISAGERMLEESGFIVDYVEVADAESLLPLRSLPDAKVALIAATIGKVRLIDNMLLN